MSSNFATFIGLLRTGLAVALLFVLVSCNLILAVQLTRAVVALTDVQ